MVDWMKVLRDIKKHQERRIFIPLALIENSTEASAFSVCKVLVVRLLSVFPTFATQFLL